MRSCPKGEEPWHRKPPNQISSFLVFRVPTSGCSTRIWNSVKLPLRKVLEQRGKVIKTIYFPESGFASVVADGDERPIEVGLIGREGMTGLAEVSGARRNSNDVYMQAPGQGHCIRADDLRTAIR